MQKSIFKTFTRKYPLSKTLRFELIPVGNTSKMLEDDKVFKKDKEVYEKYKKTKPFLDRLHQEFIKDAFNGKELNKEGLNLYFDKLNKLNRDRKNRDAKEELNEVAKTLRRQVGELFKIEDLFGEKVFRILKSKYGNEEETFLKDSNEEFLLDEDGNRISIFDSWDKFTTYFSKFHESRKNFYKDNGKEVAIPTRIVDNNLRRFCDNINIYESIKDKVSLEEIERCFSVNPEELFSVSYYNNCLLQEGIDAYNKVIGGELKEDGTKTKGINEFINEYRQTHKGEKLSFLKQLNNQILGGKDDFCIESIENKEEFFKKLGEFHISSEEKTSIIKKLFFDFFENHNDYDLNKIYISKPALNTILYKWIDGSSHREFEENLYKVMKTNKPSGLKYDKNLDLYKFPDFINLQQMKDVLGEKFSQSLWKRRYYSDDNNEGTLEKKNSRWEEFIEIFRFEIGSLFRTKIVVDGNEKDVGYEIYSKRFEEILERGHKEFSEGDERRVAVIKDFVDNVLSIYQIAKYFALEKKRVWLEEYDIGDFYTNSQFGYLLFYENAYVKIVKARMLIQNWLLKKPFSDEKWKLHFENSQLAGGFDKSKENDYSTVILRKDSQYYLGIMKRKSSKIFSDEKRQEYRQIAEDDGYEKMIYKQIANAKLDIHNLVKSDNDLVERRVKDTIKYYPRKIAQIKERSSYSKGSDNFNRDDFETFINYKKECAIKYWPQFSFNFSSTKDYNNFNDFTDEIQMYGYNIQFEGISKEYVNKKNNEGELYLFKIYNRDWNPNKSKTGTKNIHSLYFEHLFSKENFDSNFLIKLNGGAEIFYRPKTDKKDLGVKKVKDGREILKHKRYSEDKIILHLSIELNRGLKVISPGKFNQEINNFLLRNKDVNIIGIDRGENNLVYYIGIDQKGRILKDDEGKSVLGSLNKIKDKNYHSWLEERARERMEGRQSWQGIEEIKDLKKGYISLVIRELADLAVKYNAILVLEDLNMRFKQIRGGIEKSVYQQLEKALINKLNFLIDKKEVSPGVPGHVLNAYQLTAPFESFKGMGKQTGIIFYTQSEYTSKTCPNCGFRRNVKWDQESIKKAKIVYDGDNFIVSYKLDDFKKQNNKSNQKNAIYSDYKKRDKFSLTSHNAIRTRWSPKTKNNIDYVITNEIADLLKEYNVEYLHGENIVQTSANLNLPKKFYKDLAFLIFLLSETRSNNFELGIDYIHCPIIQCEFHSKDGFQGVEFNGDANGAYNIARKGLIILDKINNHEKRERNLDKLSYQDLFISIDEWDRFVQQ